MPDGASLIVGDNLSSNFEAWKVSDNTNVCTSYHYYAHVCLLCCESSGL